MEKNEKLKLAVFGSGRGSNFEAIVKSIKNELLDAEIVVVVSDNSEAKILKTARELAIPVIAEDAKKYSEKIDHEKSITKQLSQFKIDLIVLAGYMRILSPYIIKFFTNRIVNIHPSLLPAFKGLHAQKQALEYGVKITGATVHLVNEEVDAGKILLQRAVNVNDDDSLEELEQRILKIEHIIYSETLQKIRDGNIILPAGN
ncbi:MAG: phosphoribosylglycinamide formyltransferase [Candidatus Kariarchaeaceae archaeon]